MKTPVYCWETGTRLAAEVQAKDEVAARNSCFELIDAIYAESNSRSFEEVKLRTLQILSIANRAAYKAGADPDVMIQENIKLANNLVNVKTKSRLRRLGADTIKAFIALIPEVDHLKNEKVMQALAYIRGHCTQSMTRDEVAGVIDCSPSYLSRILRNVVGCTFKEMLTRYRIEKAKELLADGRLSITRIAHEAGYNDANYFTVVFKKVTGVTPHHYQRRIRE